MLRTLVLAAALAVPLTGCGGAGSADDTPTNLATTAVDAGTDPGTALAYGEAATLVWQPSAELTGELELSVDAVAEQRPSVFEGWNRDDAMAAARPYFVTVSLTNTGESDLGDQVVPVYLRDDRGTLGAPWTVGGEFTDCQSGPLPAPFPPGESAEICLVYLAPDGARIEDMVFEPTEGYDPISWSGDVTPPARREPAGTRKGSRGRG